MTDGIQFTKKGHSNNVNIIKKKIYDTSYYTCHFINLIELCTPFIYVYENIPKTKYFTGIIHRAELHSSTANKNVTGKKC